MRIVCDIKTRHDFNDAIEKAKKNESAEVDLIIHNDLDIHYRLMRLDNKKITVRSHDEHKRHIINIELHKSHRRYFRNAQFLFGRWVDLPESSRISYPNETIFYSDAEDSVIRFQNLHFSYSIRDWGCDEDWQNGLTELLLMIIGGNSKIIFANCRLPKVKDLALIIRISGDGIVEFVDCDPPDCIKIIKDESRANSYYF
jgi:hypothetical protein